MTGVRPACLFKNSLPKLAIFGAAVLVMEGKQHFQHPMLYYFKKSESATEVQKRLVQGVEKVLGHVERVGRVCEVLCWRFLAG